MNVPSSLINNNINTQRAVAAVKATLGCIKAEKLVKAADFTVATTVVATAGPAAAGAVGAGVLNVAGFTAIGPAAGTVAANWMSSIALTTGAGVQAGSWYAFWQSVAMTGALINPAALTVGAVAMAGGAAYAVWRNIPALSKL